jgi:hypothetical protein
MLARQFQIARIVHYDNDESDPEGHVLRCDSYSRELKLSAIRWALHTYVRGKRPRDPHVLILGYQAAARLQITTTMLQTWIRNRVRIAN